MNRDKEIKVFRLRGLSLQFERGDYDRIFAEAEVPIVEMRADVVRFVRQLADDIERGGE